MLEGDHGFDGRYSLVMTSLSFADIARLEERRAAIGTKEIAREAQPFAGGVMCYDHPGAWANQAMAVGLDGSVSEREVDRMVTFYESRGVEPRLELTPFADETLVNALARRRFELRGFENVLAREITEAADLRSSHPFGWPEGLEILTVDPTDEESVRTFVELSTSGFRPPDQPIDPSLVELTSKIAGHPRCTSFIARVHGAPAGAASMEIDGEAAALFGTSVLPEFQRRGIQLALMLERLELGRGAGARVCTIGSKPGIPTERNARRLGFFIAYSKVVLARSGEGLTPSP